MMFHPSGTGSPSRRRKARKPSAELMRSSLGEPLRPQSRRFTDGPRFGRPGMGGSSSLRRSIGKRSPTIHGTPRRSHDMALTIDAAGCGNDEVRPCHLGIDRVEQRVEVGDRELAEVEAQHERSAEPHAPAGQVVAVLVERARAEVRARVDGPEGLVAEGVVELPRDDVGDVVAPPAQLRRDRHVRVHVAPVGHRVEDDAGHVPPTSAGGRADYGP